jgi:hypothetical protein|tara:strand:+ start:628 stop:1281 length:654 start_codon:yes stop_codon:yes gene_type:complete
MTSHGWITTKLVAGHGVASGKSTTSPYPEGTIAMQRRFFAELGLDLSGCWPGTLNLSVAPLELQLRDPDVTFPLLRWTDLHPAETFSFWRITLQSAADGEVQAWIYYPHPETKERHQQPRSVVEVLAPRLRGIEPGSELLIHDPSNRIGCVDGPRLRAQLLEFLKFRVLAAQDGFFVRSSFEERRSWLRQHHPQALMLDDISLQSVWNRAHDLYTES